MSGQGVDPDGRRVVIPVASQKRGPSNWAFLVKCENGAVPFAAGDVVMVATRSYAVVAVERASTAGHVNLVARPAR